MCGYYWATNSDSFPYLYVTSDQIKVHRHASPDTGLNVRCVTDAIPEWYEPIEIASDAYILYFAKNADNTDYARDGMLRIGRWGTPGKVAAREAEFSRVDQVALFKFGSVLGLSNPMWSSAYTHDYWSADDVLYNPSITVTSTSSWGSVPWQNANVVHSLANLKAGMGDPCRLAGYSASQIKTWLNAGSVPDNKKWRLPTPSENNSFAGVSVNPSPLNAATYQTGTINEKGELTALWSATGAAWLEGGPTNAGIGLAYMPGSLVTKKAFLPAVGIRERIDGQQKYGGNAGYFWTMQATTGTDRGVFMSIFTNIIHPSEPTGHRAHAWGIRCVPQ